MTKQYRHLFFDLDHTLWDFESNAREVMFDLYELNELPARGVDDFGAFFRTYSAHNERLWDRYTRGFIKQEELRWKRMWLSLLDFKIADEALARQMAAQFLERLPFKTNLFPYVHEILVHLKGKGYHLHLITNGFERIQHNKLASSSLGGYFDKIITSEASGHVKPAREIFDYAREQAGAAQEECVMIGDNQDADIQGGINAGWDTVFVNHIGADPRIRATHTIEHLRELEEIFP